GPMFAGIVAGTNDATVRVPRVAFAAAQSIVGCLVASSIEPGIFPVFMDEWPIFLGAVAATLMASSVLGWLISRWRILPGTTAVWGSTPGAATAMVLMAGAFGADQRLVAFMQYLRMAMVTAAAAVVARWWVGAKGGAPAIDGFPPGDWMAFAQALGVAIAGTLVASLLGLRSLFFIGPMVLGIALKFAGLISFELPPWLLAASYAVIGWSIGARFTRQTVNHVWRALPQVVISILALILF